MNWNKPLSLFSLVMMLKTCFNSWTRIPAVPTYDGHLDRTTVTTKNKVGAFYRFAHMYTDNFLQAAQTCNTTTKLASQKHLTAADSGSYDFPAATGSSLRGGMSSEQNDQTKGLANTSNTMFSSYTALSETKASRSN